MLDFQGTFGREPQASKPEDDRYLRAAIQEYDNIAKLGQIMREGPIKVSSESYVPIVTDMFIATEINHNLGFLISKQYFNMT